MNAPNVFIHPTAVVDEPAFLGEGVKIWHFCHVCSGARIGRDSSIGQNGYVAATAIVGERCRIQNNVSLYDGVVLADDVFVGPSAVFTNVVNPRAHVNRRSEFRTTVVQRGVTIGANATILPGVVLGSHCFVAAGAVVTEAVRGHALVAGVPARQIGWVSEDGNRLSDGDESNCFVCVKSGRYYRLTDEGLIPASETAENPGR
ncbi:MAG: DapH/DapD/GlmU-related protein [Polyangiaceae bacterium]